MNFMMDLLLQGALLAILASTTVAPPSDPGVQFLVPTTTVSPDTIRGPARVQSFAICVEKADAKALRAVAKNYRVRIRTQVDKGCRFTFLANENTDHTFPAIYRSGPVKTINTNKCVIDYKQSSDGFMAYAVTYYIKQKEGSREECFVTLVKAVKTKPSSATP